MAGRLNGQEINSALKKIRSRYNELIRFYKKPHYILDAFEERYISALKNKMDLSVFLLAEIEVVEKLIIKEKQAKTTINKEKKKTVEPTFADKVFEENRKKLNKYPSINIAIDADEEMEHLFGAIRSLLNNYWPAILVIFRDKRHTHTGDQLNEYYNKLLANYDYTGPIPIAKHYVDNLANDYGSAKKVDFEHRIIMQETAFLLNDICDFFIKIINNHEIPDQNKILVFEKGQQNHSDQSHKDLFKGRTYSESFHLVLSYMQDIITDFRFKGIKRQY